MRGFVAAKTSVVNCDIAGTDFVADRCASKVPIRVHPSPQDESPTSARTRTHNPSRSFFAFYPANLRTVSLTSARNGDREKVEQRGNRVGGIHTFTNIPHTQKNSFIPVLSCSLPALCSIAASIIEGNLSLISLYTYAGWASRDRVDITLLCTRSSITDS